MNYWILLLEVGGVLLILFKLLRRTSVCVGKRAGKVRPPVENVLANMDSVRYHLRAFSMPVFNGRILKIASWLGYTPLGRMLITKPTIRRSDLDLLAGEYIPENPIFSPEMLAPPGDHSAANRDIIKSRVVASSNTEGSGGFKHNTVLDYYNSYQSGKCTPVMVAKSILQAIEQSNSQDPPLRAMVDWDSNVIMALAEESVERWKNGKLLSFLDGVPIAFKAECMVEPYSFTAGTEFKPASCEGVREGPMVRALREAGALVIGITNMQEMGAGTIGSNPNPSYKTSRNPYSTDHYCGGSSSGSAAAVACGLCPIAIGADGGGSIRIPASYCGVAGIKPTFGFLSKEGFARLAYSVSVCGPLGSSFMDLAIAMDVIAQSPVPISLDGLGEREIGGLRVGVYWEYFQDCDATVASACKDAVKKMSSMGATIVDIRIPELEEMRVAHACTIMSDMANAQVTDIDKHFDEYASETLTPVGAGLNFSAVSYINASKQKARGIKIMKVIFEKVDVIVTPTTANVALKIHPNDHHYGILDATNASKAMRYAFIANLLGIPGVAVPVGTTPEGLPISLQVLGPWYSDGLLLKVGYALEMSIQGCMPRPKVYYDILESCQQ